MEVAHVLGALAALGDHVGVAAELTPFDKRHVRFCGCELQLFSLLTREALHLLVGQLEQPSAVGASRMYCSGFNAHSAIRVSSVACRAPEAGNRARLVVPAPIVVAGVTLSWRQRVQWSR